MASINKLSVRGVRSFSSEEEEQVIEFLFPVTIIVGANGCGKTTIIESLKYAVTGALPPGKNPGQSFVHDPKALGQSVVKANIKLRFTNKASDSMVLVRAMELTQKKTTMTFKALDGVLRTTDKTTGERLSMSHKCTELDRQIPLLLGVSKPILEHVVFCHQEDSSWPLMDAAVLKKRFDDIFDSTRYAKALKNIAEIKKEYLSKAKDLKAEVSGLASHKHAAKSFRQELEEQQERLDALEEQIEQQGKEIRKIGDRREKLMKVADTCDDIKAEINDCFASIEKQKDLLSSQRSMLETDMTTEKSVRELRAMLSDFDEEMSKEEERKQEMEAERKKLQDEIYSMHQTHAKLSTRRGTLKAEKDNYEKLLRQRLRKMELIADRYNVALSVTQATEGDASTVMASQAGGGDDETVVTAEGSIVTISAEDMNAFNRALAAKEEEIKTNLSEMRSRNRTDDDRMNQELSELTARKVALEHDKNKISEQKQEAQTELQSANTQNLNRRGRTSKNDIKDAKERAKKLAKMRDEAKDEAQKFDLQHQVRSCQNSIDKLKRQVEDDQQALNELRHCSEAQNEIGVLKDQATKELEALSESLQDNSFELQKFNLAVPSPLPGVDGGDERGDELIDTMEALAGSVREKMETSKESQAKLERQVSEKQRVVSEKQGLLTHNQQSFNSLSAKTAAISGADGSLAKYRRVVAAVRRFAESTVGESVDFDENKPSTVASFLSSRLDALEKESITEIQPEVVKTISKRFVAMIRQSINENNDGWPTCPCCQQLVVGDEKITRMKANVTMLGDSERSQLLATDRAEVERKRSTKNNYQRWRNIVSEVMSDVLDSTRLESEVEELESSIKELEASLATEKSELDKMKSDLTELDKEVNDLQSIESRTRRWSDDASRISEKKHRINQKNMDLSMSMSTAMSAGNRDMRTVERDYQNGMDEKEKLVDKLQTLTRKQSDMANHVSNLTAQAANAEKAAQDMEVRFAQEQQFNVRKEELNAKMHEWEDEDKKLTEQITRLNHKISHKKKERDRHRELAKDEEDKLSESLNSFHSETSTLRDLTSQIDGHTVKDSASLDELESKIAKLDDEKRTKTALLEALEPDLEKVSRSLNDQERHKKVIQDNIAILTDEQKIKDLRKDKERFESQLAEVEGHDTYETEIIDLDRREMEVKGKVARHEGRRGGFVDQIRTLKRKLMTSEYKDIDERHRQMVIKKETTEIAVKDLERYGEALDNALLRYHSLKINDINKIIKELWTLTYKGEDITSIKVISGAESGARKSYNYRVAMTKGATELDMRGRCSAGQRVLASLVIRLALAETFCVNCGCIALDEPTVNLDHNNKRGLAIALAQIIASRSKQRNFQLIVITHDEDFVVLMKQELSTLTGFSMPEKYFQVRREEAVDGKFYSKIDAVDWDELGM